MTGAAPFLRRTIADALGVGSLGGVLAALMDLARVSGEAPVAWLRAGPAYAIVIGLYAALGATLAATLGIAILFVLLRGRFPPHRRRGVVTLAGIFIGLALTLAAAEAIDLLRQPALVAGSGLLVTGVCAVTGAVAASRRLRRRAPSRNRVIGFGVAVVILAAVSSLVGGGLRVSPPEPATSVGAVGLPNIVWIVLDGVRADHLSCYGYKRPTTPYLDRLSRESVL
jgi:hypothetical protein